MRWAAAHGSSHELEAHEGDQPRVTREGDWLGYSGKLTQQGLAELRGRDAPSVRALRIRSSGGEVGTGMDFGDWIRARSLDVEVVDYCVSSCANYVFASGKRKSIFPGGAVIWHGNLHQADVDASLHDLFAREGVRAPDATNIRAEMARLAERECAFFAIRGVRESICRDGFEVLGARAFFTMSIDDMRRYGLDVERGPRREADIDPRVLEGTRFVTVPPAFEPRSRCDAK